MHAWNVLLYLSGARTRSAYNWKPTLVVAVATVGGNGGGGCNYDELMAL